MRFILVNYQKEARMETVNAWLVTLLGVLLILPALSVDLPEWVVTWAIPIIILVIGIGKLVMQYKE